MPVYRTNSSTHINLSTEYGYNDGTVRAVVYLFRLDNEMDFTGNEHILDFSSYIGSNNGIGNNAYRLDGTSYTEFLSGCGYGNILTRYISLDFGFGENMGLNDPGGVLSTDEPGIKEFDIYDNGVDVIAMGYSTSSGTYVGFTNARIIVIDNTAPKLTINQVNSDTYYKSREIVISASDDFYLPNDILHQYCYSTSYISCTTSWQNYNFENSFIIGGEDINGTYLLVKRISNYIGTQNVALYYSLNGTVTGSTYSSWVYIKIRLDNTNPYININDMGGIEDYYKGPIAIVLTAFDNSGGSGLNSGNLYQYCLSSSSSSCDNSWQNYTSGEVFYVGENQNGYKYLLVKLIYDIVENRSEYLKYGASDVGYLNEMQCLTSIAFLLDSTLPKININMTSGMYSSGPFQVVINVSDPYGSGLNPSNLYKYCYSNYAISCSTSWNTYTPGQSFFISSSS